MNDTPARSTTRWSSLLRCKQRRLENRPAGNIDVSADHQGAVVGHLDRQEFVGVRVRQQVVASWLF